jgi:hypothetical protein
VSDRIVAQLSEDWRVIEDPLQWILQRKKGNPRKKNLGWTNRSFSRTREALLQCISEYCGDVDPAALAQLRALPNWYVGWDRENLDAHGTSKARHEAIADALATKSSEALDTDE